MVPQYPLIHTKGEDGFQFNIKRTNPATGEPAAKGKVSPMDFYSYRLMKRPGKSDHLLRSGDLLSQYVVDVAAKSLSVCIILFLAVHVCLRNRLFHLIDTRQISLQGIFKQMFLCVL